MRNFSGCLAFIALLSLAYTTLGMMSDLERTKVDEMKLWQRSNHQMASVAINKAPVGSILAPLLSYKFLLPLPQLRAGFAYAGARVRLRRFVRNLLQGRTPLKIGALGGSVTWGQGASQPAQTGWFSVVARWLAEAFPHLNITVRNGAVPATPASYMVLCLEHYVDPDVDLVFVEYILNNGLEDKLFGNNVVQIMERLIRRLLDLPGSPAVVLLQVPPDGMASYSRGMRFYETMEDLEGSLAQYYDVQYLSLRTALYRLAAVDMEAGFLWNQTFVDHHPGDSGNRMMADLVAYMIQDTALDLLLDPLSPREAAVMSGPLPGPMYEGNVPPGAPMCLVGEQFRSALVSARGFEYGNEGTAAKPKWGFIATVPGSKLELRFDTRRPALPAGELVSLYLQLLKSYEHMGMANASCSSGCTCNITLVDAHTTQHWSQTCQVRILVSQSADCRLTVAVLQRTRSGQHKFKVTGAVIAENADSAHMLYMTADPEGCMQVYPAADVGM